MKEVEFEMHIREEEFDKLRGPEAEVTDCSLLWPLDDSRGSMLFDTLRFLIDLHWFLVSEADCKLLIGIPYSIVNNSVLGTNFYWVFTD